MTASKLALTAGNAHYAAIRYLGLGGRIAGTNEAPLRICNGTLAIKRRGAILPVIDIVDGFAVVPIDDVNRDKLADTPRDGEGGWDWVSLAALAPVITQPWDVDQLKAVRFKGTKEDAEKTKSSAVKPTAENTGAKRTGMAFGADKPAATPQPKAEPAMSYTGMTKAQLVAELAKLQAALTAMPEASKAKARKAK